MKVQQNCSVTGNLTYIVSTYNPVTNVTNFTTLNNGGGCLPLPGITATTTVQTISYPFSSPAYQMTLNIDCLFGSSFVVQAISSILGTGQSQILISSVTCGSLTMVFSCGSSISPQDAQATCLSIINSACNPTTTLYQKLQGISCGTFNASGSKSSTSLYGLFALVALPVLILFCLILWYRTRQREADNQYMQDTATFSNVASSPQALGTQQYYPAPSTFTQPSPYAPVDPYMKPY